MGKKTIVGLVIGVAVLAAVVSLGRKYGAPHMSDTPATTSSSVRFVSSTVTADGTVTAQSLARLNFQTSGKLTYLPFKEGDKVSAGQIVAQLDTYQMQRQLSAALNTYRSTRDSFDQTQSNAQTGILQGSQKYGLQVTNRGGNFNVDEVMGDIVKRILDQNQATLDNSVINVELANYALQLSRLVSPIDGIVTHQDVTVAGVNVTPSTGFIVADPDTMVFRVNIPAEQIYYVSEGSGVSVVVDGMPGKMQGTVARIYPSKTILPGGQAVYQADIESQDLKKSAKLDTSGKAIITTNAQNVALIPAWTVLAGKYVWVDNGGKPELREVAAGKVHGNEIEIFRGLSPNDRIITDPSYITSMKY